MKVKRLLFLFWTICIVCNLSAQNSNGKVFPYKLSQRLVGNTTFYECMMNDREAINVETPTLCQMELRKKSSVFEGDLTLYLSSYAQSVIKWSNSISGDKKIGTFTIVFSNNTKMEMVALIRDVRLSNQKGSDSFGGVSISLVLNSEAEYTKLSKYNIKSIRYDGSILNFDISLFPSAPTIASMFEKLKTHKN